MPFFAGLAQKMPATDRRFEAFCSPVLSATGSNGESVCEAYFHENAGNAGDL